MHTHTHQWRKGLLLVLISGIAYGSQPLFAIHTYESGANPVGLLLSRFTIASVLLWGWLYWRRIPIPTPKQAWSALLTGLGYGAASMGYYNASHSSSVSLAVILMFSFPAFVVLISSALLKTPLTTSRILALLCALSGVLLASGMDFHGDLKGISWALFAAFSYGCAILYGSHKLPAQGSLGSAAFILLGCLLPFVVSTLWQTPHWPQGTAGWTATIGLALFATILPIATFIAGAAIIGASDSATLSTLEPIVAVAFAITILGEPLHFSTLAGGALVVTATLILARNKPTTQKQPTDTFNSLENV